jgi:cytoskeletal protein CcmA (bactofilin family)
MKNTVFIVMVLLLLMSNELYAVELMRNGFPFGSVEQNGDLRINGHVKGHFEPNGDISAGGHIEVDGSIRKGGRIVGNVDAEGYVRIDGALRGRVEPNGDIIENGVVIGSARGLDKRQAAVIFFFKIF